MEYRAIGSCGHRARVQRRRSKRSQWFTVRMFDNLEDALAEVKRLEGEEPAQ